MKVKFLFLLLFIFPLLQAEKSLTIEEAVSVALKNNFGILVAHNDAEIAKVNNTLGNAGMLPTVELTGDGQLAQNHVYQKASSGDETTYNDQTTKGISAGVQLSWTLFDGGKMFIAKNKLDELESLGEIQFQAKVIETVYNVTAAYYNVVKQEQQLKSINEAINYNKERVKIAQIGYDSGSLIKTDFLQAKIDLNVALENSINQQYAIDQAKKDLNLLLGQMVGVPFTVSENIPFDYKPDKALLIQRLNTSNYDILALNKQLQIAQLTLRESKKANLPQVSVRGGYYFSNTDNSVGNTLQNQVYGPQIGASISIPLYRGGETKRTISAARINVLSAEYELSEVKNQVNTELEKALIDFDNQQQLMEIEKENNQLAKENFEISLQRLRLGQTISLEVHQAEEDYVQSCTRLINFQYNLKIAEMRLKQLVSGL